MPPEQAAGKVGEIDARSDVFALGAILYKILTHEPPYSGPSVTEVLRKAIRGEFLAPRVKSPWLRIPGELQSICLKAMRWKKEERYESVETLIEDVRAYQDHRPVRAHPYGILSRFVRMVRRHPAGSMAGGVALVLISLGSAATGMLLSRAQAIEAREAAQAARADAEAIRADLERRRADEAEVEKGHALDRAKGAEDALTKGRAVSAVLRSADAELRETLLAMEVVFTSPRSMEKIRAVNARAWKKVEAFERSVPKDTASQAAWLALKGWLRRLAGYEQEGFDLLRRSRATDPDVAYGLLFEAMIWLIRYIHEQPLASGRTLGSRVVFEEIPKETERMKLARTQLPPILEAVAKKPVWGESSSEEFLDVLEGFRGVHRGDLEAADRGLTRALSVPEMVWLVREIRLARAKVRYMRKEFRKALEDLEAVIRAHPQRVFARYLHGQMCRTGAASDTAAKRDPRASLQKSVEAFDALLRLCPDHVDGRVDRGLTHLTLAQAQATRGEDPRPALEKALADFDEAERQRPGFVHVFMGRGNYYNQLGDARLARKEDARSAYRKAIDQYTLAVRADPARTGSRYNRAQATTQLAIAMVNAGDDPRDVFRKAIAEYDDLLAGKPGALEIAVRFNRGHTYDRLGTAQQLRREDPMPSFRKSLEDYDWVLKEHPGWVEAHANRGTLLVTMGVVLYQARKDPGNLFERAVADFDELLRRDPDRPDIVGNRILAITRQGEVLEARGMDPRPLFRKAIAEGEAFLGRDPGHVGILIALGEAYLLLGIEETQRGKDGGPCFEKSQAAYDEAARFDPTGWKPRIYKGRLFEKLGRFTEALETFETAKKVSPVAIPLIDIVLRRARFSATGPEWAQALAKAKAFDELGDYRAVIKWGEKVIAGAKQAGAYTDPRFRRIFVGGHLSLAGIYAQMSIGKIAPKAEAKPVDPEERTAYQKKSIAQLDQALAFRMGDPGRTVQDKVYDPLRELEEFKALLQKWKK
jgi:serine/threonine-protein kinase